MGAPPDGSWRKWFAWYPVYAFNEAQVTDKVWLKIVDRRLNHADRSKCEYRIIEDK